MNPASDKETAIIRVVGICGSLRQQSLTRMALKVALDGAAEAGALVQLLDLRDYDLPFVTSDDGPEQSDPNVLRLRADVRPADGMILATPEYHGSFSGVLKNALDLMGFDEFEGKMIGLIGVSGGKMGAFDALNSLRNIGRTLHAWVVPEQASVPEASNVFDSFGEPTNPEIQFRLRQVGSQVARFGRLHKCAAEEFLDLWEKAPANPGGEKR
jgi:NAD(P)H-dependent FMN reductase